jgi:hypothetical protein
VISPITPYLWHDRLSILALDVAERHFRALVLVDSELWIINVWYLVKRNYMMISKYAIRI